MWGTFILELFERGEAAEVQRALEELLGPESGSTWATGGVYVFWDPVDCEALYVGITGDLPLRFAEHLGLRSAPEEGCRREQIADYFEDGRDRIGYTVIVLSGLDQQSTARQRAFLDLEEPELIQLNEELGAGVKKLTRKLEGGLIAAHKARTGSIPRWNRNAGLVPARTPRAEDPILATATARLDNLLQARRTIRQLAEDRVTPLFEEHLHAARIRAVMDAAFGGTLDDEAIRRALRGSDAWPELREKILGQRLPRSAPPGLVAPIRRNLSHPAGRAAAPRVHHFSSAGQRPQTSRIGPRACRGSASKGTTSSRTGEPSTIRKAEEKAAEPPSRAAA
jgi:hypothetical protein